MTRAVFSESGHLEDDMRGLDIPHPQDGVEEGCLDALQAWDEVPLDPTPLGAVSE